ncbi:TetR/AcrR family transcriptional regulator [Yersinia intermedia]|uniref:TetR/AcrR family transcriptional regulator n=1 Tax=Yersinia intermedia TaxID=631 RepID=UPI0022FDB6C3|nr:TetR/AcrR family transcriptional regulator [Yersinia intermedia]MDA5481767.1 TetR/AcrR family transcriptional regulator [Yersinia intermedia]
MMNYKPKIYSEILDVAENLFNRLGYCAVGVDVICEKSNVSKATMYKYFNNKEGLIEQVLLRRDSRFREGLTHVVESSNTSWGKINGILNWHLDWFKSPEFTGCMFISADSEFHYTNQNIFKIIHQHKKWLVSLLKNCIDENNAKRDELAQMIMIFIEGMISYATVFDFKNDFSYDTNIICNFIEGSFTK